MADMWTDPDDDPRNTGATPPGEKATLEDYLRHYRLTLELKCEDLTPEQLATRSVPPSTMSLLGLVRHLAMVEHNWFQIVAQGTGEPRLFKKPDDRDWDFNGAVGTQECVEEAFTAWKAEIAKAEQWFDAVPEDDLGRELTFPNGRDTLSIRDLVVHMIEEYARHCGHADLLRECIDGRTGQ